MALGHSKVAWSSSATTLNSQTVGTQKWIMRKDPTSGAGSLTEEGQFELDDGMEDQLELEDAIDRDLQTPKVDAEVVAVDVVSHAEHGPSFGSCSG